MNVRSKALITCGIFFLLVTYSMGSGFSLFEQGNKATAMGGAFTATADDPSAIFYNPGGIAFFTQKELYINGNKYTYSGSFSGANPFPGEGVNEKYKDLSVFVPSVFYVHPINDKFTVGVGFYTPFGFSTEWEAPQKFTGRFIATRARLGSYSITPTVAYHFNENLGVGFGLELRESRIIMEKNLPVLMLPSNALFDLAYMKMNSGYKMNVAFNVGVLYKFMDSFRVGFTYRHSAKAKYSGNASFTLIPLTTPPGSGIPGVEIPAEPIPANMELNFPSTYSFGFAYQPHEDLNIELDINWAKWNTFKQINIDFPENPVYNSITSYDYFNTMSVRIGAEYKLQSNLIGRAGYYFDQSPVPDKSIDPFLPDSSRHGMSVGIAFIKANMKFEIYNLLSIFQKADTMGSSKFNYNGIYKKVADVVGISVNYQW